MVGDSDTAGPEIVALTVNEYQGNNDGLISPNEKVKISYSLADQSGIGTTSLLIDNSTVSVSGMNGDYYAIVGPLSQDPIRSRFELPMRI